MGGSSRKSEIRKHSHFRMGRRADSRKSADQKAFDRSGRSLGGHRPRCSMPVRHTCDAFAFLTTHLKPSSINLDRI